MEILKLLRFVYWYLIVHIKLTQQTARKSLISLVAK